MERRLRLRKQRRRFAIALVVSVGFHALLFAFLEIRVPGPTERRDSAREITLIQLPEDVTERPLEVVALAELPARDPGAVTEAVELPATLELVGDARGTGEFQLAAAEAVEETAIPLQRAQRGVVARRAGGSSTRLEGVTFRPASRAARDAERDRRGGGIGGLGGIGVTIIGGLGGDPVCKPRGGTTTLPGTFGRPRGLGGLPTIGTAGGIVPAPSGTGLIDRAIPAGRR